MITTLVAAAVLGVPQFDAPMKPGTLAPAWTAKTAQGQTLTLKGELKGRKAMLLNFWFYG